MSKKDSTKYVSMKKEEWKDPEKLELIEKWAREGLIIENVANNMGIATSTFYIWKKEMPELEQAWLRGKLHADTVVLNAMFRAATGYTVEEKTETYNRFGKLAETKVSTRHIPANANVMDKWLKNRMGNHFKDNQLTDTYRKKVEAETALIEAKVKLLNGDIKDTGHLAALAELFKGNDR